MLQPLGQNILIRPHAVPDRTESGLHLVEHWTQENTGEVVRVFRAGHIDCPECGSHTEVPPSVTVGDHVLFASESGQELRIAGDRLLLLRDTDLLAVFEPEVTT